MEQRIRALTSGTVRATSSTQSTEWPAQSTEWRWCLEALERERETAAEIGSAMQRRILGLARRLGEATEDWTQCMEAVEAVVEQTLRGWDAEAGTLNVPADSLGPGAGLPVVMGEAGGLVWALEELLVGMQAQGWEFSSFFKAQVPEPLRRSDVYLLLHALISEHHDRLRIAAKRSLYNFRSVCRRPDRASDRDSAAALRPGICPTEPAVVAAVAPLHW